jgi:hypothetical protein
LPVSTSSLGGTLPLGISHTKLKTDLSAVGRRGMSCQGDTTFPLGPVR